MPFRRFRLPLNGIGAVLLGVALLLAGTATEASARKQFGAALMFRDDADFGAQVRWSRGLGETLLLTPQVGYFFDESIVDLNADLHLVLNNKEDSSLYLLGGINLATDFDDVSEAGANLGAGMRKAVAGLNAFAEVKYVLSDLDGLALHLGLHF